MDNMDLSTDDPLIVNEEMNVGTINVLWFPQLYWVFVGAVIAVFTFVNFANYILYRQRIHAARKSQSTPASPKNWIWRIYATLTATLREASNASLPTIRLNKIVIHSPTVGSFTLVSANFILLMALCFYALNPSQYSAFQNIGYRTGYMSMAQLPLIFLLAGKNNLIGSLTGCSYERLNWIHRWCARSLLVTVTLHMGYWYANWAPYGYIGIMSRTDPVTIRGIAAWAILVWIIFSSFAPIRGWNYEFFVVQHAISYIGFIAMIFLHTPDSDHGWLWAPVAIYLLDRVTRAITSLYTNLAICHPKQRQQGNYTGAWACKAELEPLPDKTTRVTIRNPPITWQAGQHAFFSCHSIVPLQSHPFTISSIPEDGKLEFLVKAHRGGTRRLFDWAEKQTGLPTIQDATSTATVSVAIEGPYGKIRPLRQFDSVVLFAGSLGATFTVPLLRDIVRQWKGEPSSTNNITILRAPDGAVTRHVRFVWVVKSRNQIKWFADQLNKVMEDVQALHKHGRDVDVDMSIYVTCDESFTEDWGNSSSLLRPVNSSSSSSTESTIDLISPPPPNNEPTIFNEKEKLKLTTTTDDNTITIQEIDPRANSTSSSTNPTKSCQPDGTCCCKSTILSETSDPSALLPSSAICNCSSHNQKTTFPPATTTQNPPPQPQVLLHPSTLLLSGRPHPSNIIRRALEQAKGESAVVCCGPQMLTRDVRAAVVRVSDERAVHKGTGAEGVWFWGEGFGW